MAALRDPARRRGAAIPLADLPTLSRAGARTRAIRLLLAAAALTALAGAALGARGLAPRRTTLIPGGRSGVVVLDLSQSVDSPSLERIGAILRGLVRADRPVGLVAFSDVAYELQPPRTPARELVPILRYFTPGPGGFPPNPWQPAFRGGTRISQGLELARSMLARSGIPRGTVVLASDLDAAGTDETALTRVLVALRSAHIRLRIVPLQASPENRAYFARVVGNGAFVGSATGAGPVRSPAAGLRATASLPVWLLVAGALLLAILAANELWCAPLDLPRRAAA